MLARLGLIAAMTLSMLLPAFEPAAAQKQGGTLRIYHRDNPPSASLHEESTVSVIQPFMAIFNNLVLFDQNKPLNSLETIVPDLAESWAWDASKTKLTFKLREGVKWHDGKPFTAKDVQCTWHALIGKDGTEEFRRNPRKVWYYNLKEVTTNGDHEATFHLGHPQPSFLMLLASGFTPVYPCHVSDRRHAHQAGRHGAVQVRRAQSQRLDQARAQSRLLEEGQALPRRHRDAHHRQPVDAHTGFRGGRVRHDVRQRHHRAADEGHGQAGAPGDLRAAAQQCQHQPDREYSGTAVRQPADPQGDGAGHRSQGLYRDPDRGQGVHGRRRCCRRRKANGPCRRRNWPSLLGYGADTDQNQGRGAQDHGGTGLWSRQDRSR